MKTVLCSLMLLAAATFAHGQTCREGVIDSAALERGAQTLRVHARTLHEVVEGIVTVEPDGRCSVVGMDGHNAPLGTCDSEAECFKRIKQLCEGAGHGGAKRSTIQLTKLSTGGTMCSGDCENNGAVAFVECARPDATTPRERARPERRTGRTR